MTSRSHSPRRVAQPSRQNTFFGGAAVLAAGIIIVKLIGMFYKIPLSNIIGEQGTADFNNAYNIYSVLLTISTAGLPVAVSKLVSEANAVGRINQVHRILRISLAMFLTMGVLSFLIMFFGAEQLAGMMNDGQAAPGIRALAPAVICVGCLSAFRGYAQGNGRMTPTAVSQIIEALCKLTVGLALAYFLVKAGQDAGHAAAGAIVGVTVGTAVALVYMLFDFFVHRRMEPLSRGDAPDRNSVIFRGILTIAIPITISSSMVGIVTVIDSSLVQGQLQRALLERPECWALYQGVADFDLLKQAIDAWTATLPEGTAVTMGLLNQQLAMDPVPEAAQALYATLEDISRILFGNYSGALNIYNLPTSLVAAITASVIPAVSGAIARHDRRGAAQITGSAMRITVLAACPMAAGLYVLGEPIMALIFPSLNADLAGPLLSTLGLATLFVCMMLVCNSILQAHGFVNLPVIIMLLGGIAKIILNYNVVILPNIGIFGAPAGNVACFALCLILDLALISRVIPRRPRFLPIFAKPIFASAVMGLGVWAVYGLLSKLLSRTAEGETIATLSYLGNAVSTLAAVLVGMVIYCVLVVVLGMLTREDLTLMPKGEKIARILHL